MLLEETVAVKDDGHSNMYWVLCIKLRPVKWDAEKYWKEGTWDTEISLKLGSNLVLEHLFQLSINLCSIRRLYDSKKCGQIKNYTGRSK